MTPEQIFANHLAALDQLEEVALQIKDQRDEAVRLLRESLNYFDAARVTEFLERLNERTATSH